MSSYHYRGAVGGQWSLSGEIEEFPRVERPAEPPVYSELVIGYRSWRLADWVLSPMSVGDPWRPGVNHARCNADGTSLGGLVFWTMARDPEPHTAPGARCHCGIYAYHEPPRDVELRSVVGAVAAWGNLEVHSNGFRAEYAQILALAEPTHLSDDMLPGFALAAETYRVPVVPFELLEAEALQHGHPLPASARPPAPKRHAVDYGAISTHFAISSAQMQAFQRSMLGQIGALRTATAPPGGGGSARQRRKAERAARRAAAAARESIRGGLPRPQRPPRNA